MNSYLRIDRESFQKLLASVFSMQESGVDAQSLSALLELEKAIASGEPDVDRAMHLVADRARNVAYAAGVAIALRRGDQLVYRAGSGCATSYVGRQITAILSVSEQNDPRSEILRVENAQTDARIEAAICRQFEAQALLILPIYNERAVAGVLEVLFREPHAFQDREMRAYRLMAGLVGEAMSREAHPDREQTLAKHPATERHAIEQTMSQTQSFPRHDEFTSKSARRNWAGLISGAAAKVAAVLPKMPQFVKLGAIITWPVKRASLHQRRWNVVMTGVISALVIATCWVVHERMVSPIGTQSLQQSSTFQQQTEFLSAKPEPSIPASNVEITAGGTQEAKTPGSVFKRVRFGPDEIDYIAQDVTIRHFKIESAHSQGRSGYKEARIGEDVTVRYFASGCAPDTTCVNHRQSLNSSLITEPSSR